MLVHLVHYTYRYMALNILLYTAGIEAWETSQIRSVIIHESTYIEAIYQTISKQIC